MRAYDRVRTARDASRPTSMDYINALFDEFIELHGDRCYRDDKAIAGGIGLLDGMPITAIGIEKGHTTAERVRRSFGASEPEGYRKAMRLMRQAEKFQRPIITFIDTSGAYCGIGAEERGQGAAIAESLMLMSSLEVPVITLLIGEGGSGGALALALSDRLWMTENAVYSVISPEGCASILWRDGNRAADAADALHLTAADALSFGIADRVLSEEGLGSDGYYSALRDNLKKEIEELSARNDLRERRYRRFRSFGVYSGTDYDN